MNEMVVANPEARLKRLEFSEYKGYRTLDFLIETPNIYIESRAFLADRNLYLLTLVDKLDMYKEADFLYFRDSFDLM
jgi:hypothetical protein